MDCLPRWGVNQQVKQAIKTVTDNLAMVSATKTGSQEGFLVPSDSHNDGLTESEKTQALCAQNADFQGVPVGSKNMRPLGIEPRTHRLKVCCSTN